MNYQLSSVSPGSSGACSPESGSNQSSLNGPAYYAAIPRRSVWKSRNLLAVEGGRAYEAATAVWSRIFGGLLLSSALKHTRSGCLSVQGRKQCSDFTALKHAGMADIDGKPAYGQ